MNKSPQMNYRQLSALSTMVLLVPALRLYISSSTELAGRSAWLTPFIALIPVLVYIRFISELMSARREGEGLPELILRSLGAGLGKAALLLSALWMLLYAGFELSSGAERLIVTSYHNSSPYAFSIIMGLACLVAALGNPRSILRCCLLMQPVVIGVLFLVLGFALFSINTDNLLPITLDDVFPSLLGSLPAVDVLSYAVYAPCFLEGLCIVAPGRFKEGSLWLIKMCLLLTALSASVLGMFGAELASHFARPFFTMVRSLVFFRTLERLEAFVLMLWLFPDFLLISLFLFSSQYCLRLFLGFDAKYLPSKLLDMSKGRWLIWLCALSAIIISLFLGPDIQSISLWSESIIPIMNLSYAFIFLPLIYIVGKLKKTL